MKNTKFKKSLSILLSVIMLVATCAISFGVSVSAATTTAQKELITFFEEETEFVALISDLTSARETELSKVEDFDNYRYQIYTTTEGCSYFVYVLADYDDYLLFVELIDLIKAASVELMANDPITLPTVNSSTFTAWNNYTLCVGLQDAVTTSGTTDATTYNSIIGAVCPGSNNAAAMPTSKGSSSYSGDDYAYAGATVTTTDGVGYLEYVDTENDYGMTYSLSYNMDVYTSSGYSICYLSSENSIVANVVDSSTLPTYMSYPDVVTLLKTTDSYYGSCGDNVYYAFSKSTGTLYIYGEGKMSDMGATSQPWYSYKSSIKHVIVQEGVTSIGSYAFYQHSAIESVSLASTINDLGTITFRECTSLTSIAIPEGVKTLEAGLFRACSSLKTIYLPSTLITISASSVFQGCSALTTVYYPGNENAFNSISGTTHVTTPSSTSISVTVVYNHVCSCSSYSESNIVDHEDATCKEYAKTYWKSTSGTTCDTCGRTGLETTESTHITYGNTYADCTPVEVEDVAATCTTEGLTGKTVCSVCGETVAAGTAISKTAHTYEDCTNDNYTDPTCTADGYWLVTCTATDCTETDKVEDKDSATGCDFPTAAELSILAENYEAETCSADGYWSDVACKNGCGELVTVTNTGSQLSHTFTKHVETVAPTCYEQGYTTYQCSMCDATEDRDYMDTLEHTYQYQDATDGDGNVIYEVDEFGETVYETDAEGTSVPVAVQVLANGTFTPATCADDAYTTYYCTVVGCDCTTVEYDDGTATNNHSYTVKDTKESTCSVAGYTHYECTTCDTAEYYEYKDLIAHDFRTKVSVYSEGTCQSNAYYLMRCYNCGAQEAVEQQDTYGECEDADGDSFCDSCGAIVEDSFWDKLVRFFLEFFEVIASWFS